jgi:hypothetical protein
MKGHQGYIALRVTAPVYSNPVLTPRSSVIRAADIIELRRALDQLLTFVGIGPSPWTDRTLVPGQSVIKAQHVTEFVIAIGHAYGAAGVTSPAWMGVGVNARTPVTAAKISDIRAAVQAIW